MQQKLTTLTETSSSPEQLFAGQACSEHSDVSSIRLEPADNERLANLCGPLDQHLRQLERRLGVEINNRGNDFRVFGAPMPVKAAKSIIRELYDVTRVESLTPARVHLFLQGSGVDASLDEGKQREIVVRTRSGIIRGRGPNQCHYVQNIRTTGLNFGIGPAGTGKTYLAVACAVEALETEQVRRLVLARPAVEAGERLGFLPGDLAQKIDPYLRPLYDALYEMLGFERVGKLIERGIIEIAPLAFMRGRTLNESFVILDEAQNTTIEQMKMFVTRMGFGTTAVVNGDITQVDLPRGQRPGLCHAIDVLKSVDGISFTFFEAKDVVRHPLVARILKAYEAHEDKGRTKPY
jgi:phosphate starvation-inducible PhoH-like protein